LELKKKAIERGMITLRRFLSANDMPPSRGPDTPVDESPDLATLLVTGALLALVATEVVTVEGAVQLAAAVLGPLFTLLALAVGYHFKEQNRG